MEELRGTRAVLRTVRAGDRPLLRKWLGDPELRSLAGRRFPGSPGSGRTDDAQFLILLRDGQRPIGLCGLYGISREEGTAEVGILLGERDTWGQGHGPEALRLLLDYAYNDLGLRQVALCVHATNARAIHAYAKVGFAVEQRLTVGRWLFGRGVEILVMTASAAAAAGVAAKGDGR